MVGGFDEQSGNENSVMRPRCDLELDGSKLTTCFEKEEQGDMYTQ